MSGSVNAYNPQWPSEYTDFSGVLWDDTGLQNGTGFGTDNLNHAVANLNLTTMSGQFNTFLADKLGIIFNDSTYNTLNGLEGKILYDQANNLYYRVSIKNWSNNSRFVVTTSDTGGSAIINYINNNLVRSNFPTTTGSLTGNLRSGDVLQMSLRDSARYIELEQVVVKVQATIDSTRLHLEDAPYDMFCIPYSDTIQMTDGADTWTCNKAVALSIATDIGAKSGSGNVYDIQLLPYCPNSTLITTSQSPSQLLNIESCNYDLVTTSGGDKISAIIWCPKSTFSFQIDALNDISGCKFTTPYESIPTSTLMQDKYYIIPILPERIPDVPGSGTQRMAISTSSGNNIHVYKISKEDGQILEDLGRYNCIEFSQSEINALSFNIYTYSHYQTPEISWTRAQYNSFNFLYVFTLETSGYGGQNVDYFYQIIKYPNLVYYDVDIGTPESAKVTNDCNLYRLSAGNYSAAFEFSPAKSGGFTGYVVDCTYKPFQP